MTALRTLQIDVGPVSLVLSRAGSPSWPDPAHRVVSLSAHGSMLVHGVCGYLSDYRVPGGAWNWAGKAHGGETEEAEVVMAWEDPSDRTVQTRALLHVQDATGAWVPIARRATTYRVTAYNAHAVAIETTTVVQALHDHEQRLEYADMLPLVRVADGTRAWSGWSAADASGDVSETWTAPTRTQTFGQSASVLAYGPRATLLRSGVLPTHSHPRTRVVDRQNDVKVYAVSLDAQSGGDQVRPVAEGALAFYSSRWIVVA